MSPQENLGQKLSEATADKARIYRYMAVRAAIFAPFILSGIIGKNPVLTAIFIALAAIPVFRPLRHLGDSVVFYERGFCYMGKPWLYAQLPPIQWQTFQASPSSPPTFFMVAGTKQFPLTYVKDPKGAYERAYSNQT